MDETDRKQLNDNEDINDQIKSSVKTDEDLQNIVEKSFKNEFNGILAKSGVKAIWSKRMTKKEVKVKSGNPIEISVSYNLLGSKSSEELVQIMRTELSNGLSTALTPKINADVNSLEKCFSKMKLKDNQLLPRAKIFGVKTEMDRKVRLLELNCIIDQRLDVLDPKPDIQILFKEYDKRYFGGLLSLYQTEVCWGDQLVSTSGNVYLDYIERPYHIRLSRKLLRFKERRHLVETLLHEMIHVYVDINELDDKSADHGPGFIQVMELLNKISGAQIPIYHSINKFDNKTDLEQFKLLVAKEYSEIRRQHKSSQPTNEE